jgi:excisionase family DNA binding protein
MLDKEYYSTIEAAKLLGVSVRTVQLWVERGALEGWKTAGGHRRINAQSVDNYIAKHQTRELSASARRGNSKRRVLIVEDNPTVCKFYEAAIKSWGLQIEVSVQKNGFDGLIEIGKRIPDLLIVDIYMPGMDGLQMINSLYKSETLSSEQIIIISGLSDASIAERGGVPAGVSFFSKPVNIDVLREVVLDKISLTLEEAS